METLLFQGSGAVESWAATTFACAAIIHPLKGISMRQRRRSPGGGSGKLGPLHKRQDYEEGSEREKEGKEKEESNGVKWKKSRAEVSFRLQFLKPHLHLEKK